MRALYHIGLQKKNRFKKVPATFLNLKIVGIKGFFDMFSHS